MVECSRPSEEVSLLTVVDHPLLRHSRAAVVLLLVVGLAAHPDGSHAPGTPSAQSDLERWLAAARDHQPGQADEATGLVSGLSLRQLVTQVLPPLKGAVHPAALDAVLKRGAMLHLDAAMIQVMTGEAFRPVPPGGLVHADYLEHLDVARRLLDWVDHPEGDADVQLWYRVVTAWMFSQRLLVAAVHHLDEVERVLGHDATALFDEGTFHELLGSPSVQGMLTSRADVRGGKPTVGSARYHFSQAERRFTRVLELDPGFVEARVRLARVQTALGQPDRAVEQLASAAPFVENRAVRYYAFLFLGRAREALGEDDEAFVAYQQAALLYPNAQSVLLAIARLASAAGAPEASLAATDRVLTLPREEQARPDPWWVYPAGIGRDAVPLAAALHARVAEISW